MKCGKCNSQKAKIENRFDLMSKLLIIAEDTPSQTITSSLPPSNQKSLYKRESDDAAIGSDEEDHHTLKARGKARPPKLVTDSPVPIPSQGKRSQQTTPMKPTRGPNIFSSKFIKEINGSKVSALVDSPTNKKSSLDSNVPNPSIHSRRNSAKSNHSPTRSPKNLDKKSSNFSFGLNRSPKNSEVKAANDFEFVPTGHVLTDRQSVILNEVQSSPSSDKFNSSQILNEKDLQEFKLPTQKDQEVESIPKKMFRSRSLSRIPSATRGSIDRGAGIIRTQKSKRSLRSSFLCIWNNSKTTTPNYLFQVL